MDERSSPSNPNRKGITSSEDTVQDFSPQEASSDQMEVIVLDTAKPAPIPEEATPQKLSDSSMKLTIDKAIEAPKPEQSGSDKVGQETTAKPEKEKEKKVPGLEAVRKEAWIPKQTDPPKLALKAVPALKFSAEVIFMKHAIEQIMLVKIKQRRDAEKSFRYRSRKRISGLLAY